MPRIETLDELSEREAVFRDRRHAGAVLADLMQAYRDSGTWVLAIPAGGVPVGVELSRRLRLPFDVAVVSKITLPWNKESGYGAIAFDGTVKLNEPLIRHLRLAELEVRYGIEKTRAKIKRRVQELRGTTELRHLEGATVVLVDDGIGSGFTILTATAALRNQGAARIVVAVPTASSDTARSVAEEVDRLYCANLRSGFPFAVADAYERWSDVDEEELRRLVEEQGKRQ